MVSPQAEQIIDYEAWANGALDGKAIKCSDHYSYTMSHTHTHYKSGSMSHPQKITLPVVYCSQLPSKLKFGEEERKNSCHGNTVWARLRLPLVPVCRRLNKGAGKCGIKMCQIKQDGICGRDWSSLYTGLLSDCPKMRRKTGVIVSYNSQELSQHRVKHKIETMQSFLILGLFFNPTFHE